jgi:NAD(P)-dependent dehydrogenase (short-subunit alcohol dehydrogenase family)
MKGTIVLVTGSTDGIGKQAALELARRGATVLVHGRNEQRVRDTVEELRTASGDDSADGFVADLSSLKEVDRLAREIKSKHSRLHVLLNNAGVFMKERVVTPDGYEMTFAVNHLAPFLLTCELLDLLKKGAPSRVITVSSVAHQRGQLDFDNLQGQKHFDGYGAYALSKLANVLFTYELAERLRGTGVTANCLHPGVIGTKLLRTGFNIDGQHTLEQGAATSVYLASAPEVADTTGMYFVNKQPRESAAMTRERELQKKLWEVSAVLCGVST